MSHARSIASVVLCLLGVVNTQAAVGAEAAYDFNLPQQSLADALRAIGRQTAMNILFEPEAVENVTAPAVRGRLSAMEAVDRLLTGTKLAAEQTAVNSLLIRPANDGKNNTSDTVLSPDAREPNRIGATSDQANGWFQRLRLAQGASSARTDSADSGERQTDARSPDSASTAASPLRAIGIENLPEVLIEGKRSLNMDIRRSRDDPQPYVIFTREMIKQSTAPNLQSFLRDQLPMNATGLPNGQIMTSAGNQSTFNLRGLGANQTLILIDGHRASPGPSYGGTPRQSDINSIPMSGVERIEVLPATSSGIYGGSATGGVINIILRHDYVGSEVAATYGNSFESDVAQRRVDVSTGFNLEGGKTHVLVIGSFSDQNPLTLQERPELAERYYSIALQNARATVLPPGNPPLGSTPNIRSVDGSNLVLKTGQALTSPFTFIPEGYAGTSGDRGAALLANAGQYNFELAESLQSFTGDSTAIQQAPRSGSVRASIHREFSSSVKTFLEGSFSESETFSPRAVPNGGATSPYRVAAAAPNNPFTRDILVTVPTDSITGYLSSSITQTRAIGGVIVSLPAKWQAEMDYTWASTREGFAASLPLPASTDAAAVRTGAVDVLRDTRAYPIDLSPFIAPSDDGTLQKVTFQDVALRLAGPVLELPAGPLSVSTLLEYRTEKYADTTQRSLGRALFYPSRSASVSSAYLETRVPLVSAKNRLPGVQELELQLATRADEYHTRGKTGFVTVGSNDPVVSGNNETRSVNPTIAMRYQPVSDLAFRASYGTGFVAPDVSQLAGSFALQEVQIIDPRRGGTLTTLAIGQALQGGNPNLGPEKSKNLSLGFILTPRVLPNLRLSLDYTRIEKTDNIAAYPTGVQGIVNDEAQLPGRIQRGPKLPGDPADWAGPIVLLDASRFNIASAEIEAFDLQLDYSWPTKLGTFDFKTVATRQTHYRTQALAGQPVLENVGVSSSNPLGFAGGAQLVWEHRNWTAGWMARYYDDYLVAHPSLASNAAAITLQGNGGRVPSQHYHDLFVHWTPQLAGGGFTQFLEETEFQLGVRNVFNKTPPLDAYVFNLFRTFYSPIGDAQGTTYQLTVRKRF